MLYASSKAVKTSNKATKPNNNKNVSDLQISQPLFVGKIMEQISWECIFEHLKSDVWE